jgi:hypothetical protein
MANSKWEEVKEKLQMVECWARDGLTDEQISNNLGISTTTFYEYKNKYPEFSESLKKGKEVVDYEVENALLKRALGYEYKEITKESRWNREKEEYELVISKEVTKQVVPDVTAQIYWLKNRKPRQWRDRIEVENGNDIQRIQIINDLPEEDDVDEASEIERPDNTEILQDISQQETHS